MFLKEIEIIHHPCWLEQPNVGQLLALGHYLYVGGKGDGVCEDKNTIFGVKVVNGRFV